MRFSAPDYATWQQVEVHLAGGAIVTATKAGLFAHGRHDAAALLIAERAVVSRGDVVAYLNCGSGLFGVVAALRGEASHVVLTDRNVISAEAARRTMTMNGVAVATVALQQGLGGVLPPSTADVVAIRIPHEKLAISQLLRDSFRALRMGGRCYLAGATIEGVKPAARAMEQLFGQANVLAAGGGYRIVGATKSRDDAAVTAPFDSPFLDSGCFHEVRATLRGRDYRLFARPGVFSWDHLDEATQILAEAMVIQPGESVLDLGCGSGALGVVAGGLSQGQRVCLVDADIEAIRSAARSADAAGLSDLRVLTSDITSAVPNERFDVVVSNPPFHLGKSTALDVPGQFIRQSYDVLTPGGRLLLVANRTLPYERVVSETFGHVRILHDGARFKVLAATKG